MTKNQLPTLKLISWNTFSKQSYQLSNKITNSEFDLLIAINRGGSVLGRILSDALGLPLLAFGMSSYEGINKQKQIKVTQELNFDLIGKRVLLIDEICDSGKTFEQAVAYAQQFNPSVVKTATLFLKPHSSFNPDFYIEKTNDWVVFPYEGRETQESLKQFNGVDHDYDQKLKEYFEEVGYYG